MDDDVVVINFETGAYYTLRGTASTIWSWIDGSSVEELLSRGREHFIGDSDEMSDVLEAFIARLASEGLIVPAPASTQIGSSIAGGDGSPDRIPFATPVLDVFKDVQELLMLDPIHDVDEQGWPTPKDETNPSDHASA